jgi:translation initiation factor 3 subunit L
MTASGEVPVLVLRLLRLAAGQEHFYTTEGYDQGTNVLRMVGYFSLVGLLRVHTLVGDYQGALKALGVIHPFQRSHLFTPKIASKCPTLPPLMLSACISWW